MPDRDVAPRLSLFGVLGRTVLVMGRNWLAIGVFSLTVSAVSSATEYAIGYGLLVAVQGVSRWAAQGLAALTNLGFLSLVEAGVTWIVVEALGGRRIGIGVAFATGMRLQPPVFAIAITVLLASALGSVLLAVPGVWLFLRWCVATPVRVAEGTAIRAALSRSAELTKGHRWLALLWLLCYAAFCLAFAGAVSFVVTHSSDAASGIARQITLVIAEASFEAVIGSIAAAGSAVLYVALRHVAECHSAPAIASVFE